MPAISTRDVTAPPAGRAGDAPSPAPAGDASRPTHAETGGFLETLYLRLDRIGMPVGVAQRMAVGDLVARLHGAGVDLLASEASQVARWLRPILVVTPADRPRFDELIEDHVARERASRSGQLSPPKVDGPGGPRNVLAPVEALPDGKALRPAAWAIVLGMVVSLAVAGAWIGFGGLGSDSGPAQPSPAGAQPPVPVLDGMSVTMDMLRRAILPALVVLALMLWRAHRAWHASRIERHFEEADIGRWRVTVEAAGFFRSPPLLRAVEMLKRAAREPLTRGVDVRHSIVATLRAGQFPVIIRPIGRRRPETVLLTDRQAPDDVLGYFADALSARLDDRAAPFTRYEYRYHPDTCRARVGRDGLGTSEPLARIAARHRRSRFVFVTDGVGLFLRGDVTIDPTILYALDGVDQIVWLTPTPPTSFGPREQGAAAAGWIVSSITDTGVENAAQRALGLRPTKDLPGPTPSAAAFLDYLDHNHLSLGDAVPPPPHERDRLVVDLVAWIGADDPEARAVLATLALAPRFDPGVVTALAAAVMSGEQRPGPETLARFARLPWLRDGAFPLWLRAAILHHLQRRDPDALARAREAVARLFLTPPPPGGFTIDVLRAAAPADAAAAPALATGASRLPDELADPLTRAVLRGEAPDVSSVMSGVLSDDMARKIVASDRARQRWERLGLLGTAMAAMASFLFLDTLLSAGAVLIGYVSLVRSAGTWIAGWMSPAWWTVPPLVGMLMSFGSVVGWAVTTRRRTAAEATVPPPPAVKPAEAKSRSGAGDEPNWLLQLFFEASYSTRESTTWRAKFAPENVSIDVAAESVQLSVFGFKVGPIRLRAGGRPATSESSGASSTSSAFETCRAFAILGFICILAGAIAAVSNEQVRIIPLTVMGVAVLWSGTVVAFLALACEPAFGAQVRSVLTTDGVTVIDHVGRKAVQTTPSRWRDALEENTFRNRFALGFHLLIALNFPLLVVPAGMLSTIGEMSPQAIMSAPLVVAVTTWAIRRLRRLLTGKPGCLTTLQGDEAPVAWDACLAAAMVLGPLSIIAGVNSLQEIDGLEGRTRLILMVVLWLAIAWLAAWSLRSLLIRGGPEAPLSESTLVASSFGLSVGSTANAALLSIVQVGNVPLMIAGSVTYFTMTTLSSRRYLRASGRRWRLIGLFALEPLAAMAVTWVVDTASGDANLAFAVFVLMALAFPLLHWTCFGDLAERALSQDAQPQDMMRRTMASVRRPATILERLDSPWLVVLPMWLCILVTPNVWRHSQQTWMFCGPLVTLAWALALFAGWRFGSRAYAPVLVGAIPYLVGLALPGFGIMELASPGGLWPVVVLLALVGLGSRQDLLPQLRQINRIPIIMTAITLVFLSPRLSQALAFLPTGGWAEMTLNVDGTLVIAALAAVAGLSRVPLWRILTSVVLAAAAILALAPAVNRDIGTGILQDGTIVLGLALCVSAQLITAPSLQRGRLANVVRWSLLAAWLFVFTGGYGIAYNDTVTRWSIGLGSAQREVTIGIAFASLFGWHLGRGPARLFGTALLVAVAVVAVVALIGPSHVADFAHAKSGALQMRLAVLSVIENSREFVAERAVSFGFAFTIGSLIGVWGRMAQTGASNAWWEAPPKAPGFVPSVVLLFTSLPRPQRQWYGGLTRGQVEVLAAHLAARTRVLLDGRRTAVSALRERGDPAARDVLVREARATLEVVNRIPWSSPLLEAISTCMAGLEEADYGVAIIPAKVVRGMIQLQNARVGMASRPLEDPVLLQRLESAGIGAWERFIERDQAEQRAARRRRRPAASSDPPSSQADRQDHGSSAAA